MSELWGDKEDPWPPPLWQRDISFEALAGFMMLLCFGLGWAACLFVCFR